MIFVAIASYADPELPRTLKDCLENARWPQDLRFGVCWQEDKNTLIRLEEFRSDSRFRFKDYTVEESQGGTWARSIAQSLWEGEAYTLQVDSHMKFEPNWDGTLISMMEELPSKKPLITVNSPLFWYDEKGCLHRATEMGTPTSRVAYWGKDLGWAPWVDFGPPNQQVPGRTRFITGNFVFTLGLWNEEVPQDPDHYYWGEEFSLTVRSFTWGYDLFLPSEIVAWHMYHFDGGPRRHWEKGKEVIQRKNAVAFERLRKLLYSGESEDLGAFGLGPIRSKRDYEIYAGFDLEAKRAHPDVFTGKNPDPVTIRRPADWQKCITFEVAKTTLLASKVPAKNRASWRFAPGGRGDESRAGGDGLTRDYVKGISVCRIFLRAARAKENAWTEESEQILACSDVDWTRLTGYLGCCGLARPLLARVKDPKVEVLLPAFFVDDLRIRAKQDAISELIQKEAISKIATVLYEMGARGVLLKGTIFLFCGNAGNGPLSRRATGDIDLYIAPRLAPVLRQRLLKSGFKGAVAAGRSASHHLAPVFFEDVAVEIHDRIMPSFWGLPEGEMLAHSIPACGDALHMLDPEGFVLHASMHASASLFSLGLKTAWDLLWALEHFPDLDWARVARWVDASLVPRGFWVPLRVLSQELEIPIAGEFLRRAPSDEQQRKLEAIARGRLFSETEGPFDLNPFVKNRVILMLHDSYLGCFRYLVTLAAGEAAQARRSARRDVPSQAFTRLPGHFRQALLQWKEYRRQSQRKSDVR